MSATKVLRPPCSIFRRLKIQPSPQQQQQHSFSTSSASLEDAARPSGNSTPGASRRRGRSTSIMGRRPQDQIRKSLLEIAASRKITPPPILQDPPATGEPRLPRNVQALYFAPLRRTPTHGIPVCNLQLRSYSVRNLEFMADFALRAAYYLNLPARGAVPLPRITERWTVPRSNFVHKKSQENWERITVRRLVQIQDGHPEVVRTWLAFVKKWCWYGVGMKADVFEWEGMDAGKKMDESEEAVKRGIESVNWELFGRRKGKETEAEVEKLLVSKGFADTASPPPPTSQATA